MTERLDCVVVGAGVVGLAVARSLARSGREVVVLEAESRAGMHASSRSSGVIHAGVYYPTDSLKARLCVSGNSKLYRYCEEHKIAHARIGKLIVATDKNHIDSLHSIGMQAKANGVDDLKLLSAADVACIEPAVDCVAALHSPSTGIVDSHELMMALQAEIGARNGIVVCNTSVTSAKKDGDIFRISIAGSPSDDVSCATLVNAAGIRAQFLAETMASGRAKIPALHLAKAHYFAYKGKSPFERLIYPLPDKGGLGIHATNDLACSVRFGPDVSWIDTPDYSFDESRKVLFSAAISEYFPDLDDDKLVPAYTGIRPKLSGPGGGFSDFVIQGESEHGIAGLVSLFGIESPGLTASLAIGELVSEMLNQAPDI